VVLMEGELQMQSEPGKGTCMILDLPVTASSEKPALPEPEQELLALAGTDSPLPSVEEAREEGTLVLLVDDHPINRMVMRSQLNALGYVCETADDGESALALWSKGRFALLLTDCNMPRMSGYELSRRIRQMEAAEGQRRVPIIACSANALSGVVETCVEAGMDDYVAKPTGLRVLAEKMGRWLPIRRRPRTSPEPPATRASNDPIDPAILHVLTKGQPAAVRRVLAHFHRVNQADAETLQVALQNVDLTTITRAAHRIKGASGLIGATALATVCQQIEDAARAGDLHAATPLRGRLDHELERLNAYVIAQR
jgi:CheY-like chemotaxis protein